MALRQVTPDQLAWFIHKPGCEGPDVIPTTGKRHGDPALYCKGCAAFAVLPYGLETAEPPRPEPTPAPRARYVLDCVRCDGRIELFNARPRIPICADCQTETRNP